MKFDKIIKETIIKANYNCFKNKTLSELIKNYTDNETVVPFYDYEKMEHEIMDRIHKGFCDFGADVANSHITTEIINTHFLKIGEVVPDGYYPTEIYIKISDIPRMVLGEELYEELLHEEPIMLTL